MRLWYDMGDSYCLICSDSLGYLVEMLTRGRNYSSMSERAKHIDKEDSLGYWITSVSSVNGDGEDVHGTFYVRLHENLSVSEQANLINRYIEHCTFSKNSWTENTESNTEDPTKICPGIKVYYYHTQWRRKLDGCEDRKELEEEFTERQRNIVNLLTNKPRVIANGN